MSARRVEAPRVALFDGYPYQRGGAHLTADAIARTGRQTGRWHATVILPDDGDAATWLRGRGTEVVIAALPRPLLRFAKSWRTQIPLVLVALPVAWWRLARAFRKFDVVHAHDLRGLALAVPAAWLSRRRVVLHLHDSNLTGRAWRAVARGPLRWSRIPIVVPSRRASVGWAGARAAALIELPHPIGVQAPAPESSDPTVVTLARLHPHKGLHHLVEAASLLAEQGVPATFVIAGAVAPGYERHAADLARDAQATGRVRLVGEVADPLEVLRGAWVYVQPSEYEAFGLGALEAAACGLPVVASDVGGLPDIVEPGVTGLLVPVGDTAALADAIAALLGSAQTRAAMGRAAVERVRERFGEEHFIAALTALYCG